MGGGGQNDVIWTNNSLETVILNKLTKNPANPGRLAVSKIFCSLLTISSIIFVYGLVLR